MDAKTGLSIWTGAGAGVFFLWAGITNRLNIGEVLASYVRGEKPPPAGNKQSDKATVNEGGIPQPVSLPTAPQRNDPDRVINANYVQQDVTGKYYIYDANGNVREQIPDVYQSRPYAYRPPDKVIST